MLHWRSGRTTEHSGLDAQTWASDQVSKTCCSVNETVSKQSRAGCLFLFVVCEGGVFNQGTSPVQAVTHLHKHHDTHNTWLQTSHVKLMNHTLKSWKCCITNHFKGRLVENICRTFTLRPGCQGQPSLSMLAKANVSVRQSESSGDGRTCLNQLIYSLLIWTHLRLCEQWGFLGRASRSRPRAELWPHLVLVGDNHRGYLISKRDQKPLPPPDLLQTLAQVLGVPAQTRGRYDLELSSFWSSLTWI